MCIEIGVEPIGIGVAELDEIDARGELFEPRQDRIVGPDDRGADVRTEGGRRSLRRIDRIAAPAAAWPAAAPPPADAAGRPCSSASHAAGRPPRAQLASRVDLVKLSDADADWLYPDLDAHAQIDRVLDLGADLVAMTRGGNGAIVATASARAEVGAVQVEVRDTIGAGDTFMVSLIHELHTSRTSLDSLREAELTRLGERAAGLAAITVGREGADLPWSEDLTR